AYRYLAMDRLGGRARVLAGAVSVLAASLEFASPASADYANSGVYAVAPKWAGIAQATATTPLGSTTSTSRLETSGATQVTASSGCGSSTANRTWCRSAFSAAGRHQS